MDLSEAHTCELCQELFIDLDDNRADYITASGVPKLGVFFNFTLRKILEARDGGCLLFTQVVSDWTCWDETLLGALESRQDDLVLFWGVQYGFRAANEPHDLCDLQWIDGMSLWDPTSRMKVDEIKFMALACHVITPEDDPAAVAVSSRPISRHPGSTQTFRRMREFLDDCLHQRGEHGRCEQVAEPTTPTRLLRIKKGQSAHYDAAIWVPDRHVQYAALSYCWGGDQVHKTTSARLASGNMDLDWHAMPKTIQDAIKTAVELGLEYPWVDSLCIIQDDDTDKMREIAQMPEIYNHALVTIVAARPKTANDGFLHEIAPTKATARMFKVAYKCADGIEGHVFLVRENEYISTEHIDTRAWTLQESYLSKRLLRYSTNQCSMVCQHSPLRPQIVDGWIKDTSNDTQQLLNNLLFPTTLAVLTNEDVMQYKAHYHETFDEDVATPVEYETENGDLIDLWIELVEDYTSRALTVASDRPLAISGLASRVAPLLQNDYKAGHWLQYMPMDLLWYVSEARESSSVYQAPSWSWTSVKGPIVFNTRGRLMSSEQQSLQILDVDVTAVDAMAPFGAVRSGQIRASGKLLKVSWTGDELVAGRGIDQAPLFSAASEDAARQFFPDTLDVDFVHALNIEMPIHREGQSSGRESYTTESELANLFLLEVFSSDAADDLYPGGSIGLVLLEVQSAHEHQGFVRIGLFDFSETDEDPDFGPIITNQRTAFDGCELSEFVIE